MGVMAAVGYTYMTNAAQAAQLNAGHQNAATLNSAVALLNSAGAVGTAGGTFAVTTAGTINSPVSVTWDGVGKDATPFYTALQGGIESYNVTATIANSITPASYTVASIAGDGVSPVWTFSGSTP